MPIITLTQLSTAIDDVLHCSNFSDYGPNGIQIEGKENITTIVSGVTASLALIEAAVAKNADAILVHHGLFWRQVTPVVGWLKQRLQLLLANNISLLAYHLPLDAHPQLGNNAQLAKLLGWQINGQFGEQNLIFHGTTAATTAAQLAAQLTTVLKRPITYIAADSNKPIVNLAWCSGGAQNFFDQAINYGVDAYITGEISEPQAHYARESGVAFFACGHHATERYGIKALGQLLSEKYQLQHHFVDIDNPA